MQPTTVVDDPEAKRRPPRTRRGALVGLAAFVLIPISVSGIRDLPDPHVPAADITAAFTDNRSEVLTVAPAGYLAAVAVATFGWWLAQPMRPAPAAAVRAGAGITAGYLAYLQITYTTLAYGADLPGLFVTTILAVPVWAIGVSALLAGTATSRTLPPWASVASAVGAAAVLPALVSYEDSGLFSPDVQQQVVANVLLIWLVVTSTAGWISAPRGATTTEPITTAHQAYEPERDIVHSPSAATSTNGAPT